MRCVVQRSGPASVVVDGREIGAITHGLVILAGFSTIDSHEVVERVAAKVVKLRIFEDDAGKMNRTVAESGGSILCVSQFTLYADLRRGNRPSFDGAATGPVAEPLYRAFCEAIRSNGVHCEEGVFGADMALTLTNDGPVTIVLDSDDFERPRRA